MKYQNFRHAVCPYGMVGISICLILLVVFLYCVSAKERHESPIGRARTTMLVSPAGFIAQKENLSVDPSVDGTETDSDLSMDSQMFNEFMRGAPVTGVDLGINRILCRMIRSERTPTRPLDSVDDQPGSSAEKHRVACDRASSIGPSSSSEKGSDDDGVDRDRDTDVPAWESAQEKNREDTSYLVRSEIGESPPERRMPVLSDTVKQARDVPESWQHIRAPSRCPDIARECRPRSPTASLRPTCLNKHDRDKRWLGPRPASGRDFAPCRFDAGVAADETGGEKSHNGTRSGVEQGFAGIPDELEDGRMAERNLSDWMKTWNPYDGECVASSPSGEVLWRRRQTFDRKDALHEVVKHPELVFYPVRDGSRRNMSVSFEDQTQPRDSKIYQFPAGDYRQPLTVVSNYRTREYSDRGSKKGRVGGEGSVSLNHDRASSARQESRTRDHRGSWVEREEGIRSDSMEVERGESCEKRWRDAYEEDRRDFRVRGEPVYPPTVDKMKLSRMESGEGRGPVKVKWGSVGDESIYPRAGGVEDSRQRGLRYRGTGGMRGVSGFCNLSGRAETKGFSHPDTYRAGIDWQEGEGGDCGRSFARRYGEGCRDGEDEWSGGGGHRKRERKGRRRRSTSYPETSSSDESTGSNVRDRRGGEGRRKWIRPDKFDGTTPLATFLTQFKTCAHYNGWNEEDKLAHLKVSLKGSAALLLAAEGDRCASYLQLEQKLKQRYGTEGQANLFRTQLRTRRRGKDESLQSVYLDISRLSALAYPGRPTEHGDAVAVDAFIEALQDDDLEVRIRDRNPRDLDAAYRAALVLEANSRSRRSREKTDERLFNRYEAKARSVQCQEKSEPEDSTKKVRFEKSKKNTDSETKVEQLEAQLEKLKVVMKEMAGNARPGLSEGVGGGPGDSYRCYGCGQGGHTRRSCPKRKEGVTLSEGRGSEKTTAGFKAGGGCFRCGEFGHFARDCPISDPTRCKGVEDDKYSVREVRSKRGAMGVLEKYPVYLDVTCKRQRWRCLLDSGCETSIIPARLMKGAKLRPVMDRLFAVNGTSIPVLGESNVKLKLGDLVLESSVLVSEDVPQPILGIDWLRQHKCVWDFGEGKIMINGRVVGPLSEGDGWSGRRVASGEVRVKRSDRRRRLTCYSCREKGHLANHCPKSQAIRGEGETTEESRRFHLRTVMKTDAKREPLRKRVFCESTKRGKPGGQGRFAGMRVKEDPSGSKTGVAVSPRSFQVTQTLGGGSWRRPQGEGAPAAEELSRPWRPKKSCGVDVFHRKGAPLVGARNSRPRVCRLKGRRDVERKGGDNGRAVDDENVFPSRGSTWEDCLQPFGEHVLNNPNGVTVRNGHTPEGINKRKCFRKLSRFYPAGGIRRNFFGERDFLGVVPRYRGEELVSASGAGRVVTIR